MTQTTRDILELIENRAIVFDTETTGFDPESGDKIVEIGAVEILNKMPTGKQFHVYINPERSIPEASTRIHGLTNDSVKDAPTFAQIAQEFIDFIGDAPLIAHNMPFDLKFLNYEFAKAGFQTPNVEKIDTIKIAREKFPGSPANLDSLCRRFHISLENRHYHGALLDSQLLAEVVLHLSGGRQYQLMDAESQETESTQHHTEHTQKTHTHTPLYFPMDETLTKNHMEFMGKYFTKKE